MTYKCPEIKLSTLDVQAAPYSQNVQELNHFLWMTYKRSEIKLSALGIELAPYSQNGGLYIRTIYLIF